MWYTVDMADTKTTKPDDAHALDKAEADLRAAIYYLHNAEANGNASTIERHAAWQRVRLAARAYGDAWNAIL